MFNFSHMAAANSFRLKQALQKLGNGYRSHQYGFKIISCNMSSLNEKFEQAKTKLNMLQEEPGNETKLKIYGFFKQATVGKCTTSRPGMLDMVGKAKWDAWNSLGTLSKEDAQKAYVDLVSQLASAESSQHAPEQEKNQIGDFKDLIVTQQGSIRIIKFNRPKKKNAFTGETYKEIGKAFQEAGVDDSVTALVITGSGDFYSSGNDLSNFAAMAAQGSMQDMANVAKKLLNDFVGAFIDFPKPLIAVINGPAVGIAVTTLGLCDIIYATDKSTFHTPFTILGQSAEGCSSYLFPRIMGQAKANEMLLLNKKITADEAYKLGFITEVFPDNVFQTEVWNKVNAIGKLPKNSLKESKLLIRNTLNEKLHQVNATECELLAKLWISEECLQAITNFFSRKK